MLSKAALEKLNIFSTEDLLNHYPFRYEDLRRFETGAVAAAKNIYLRSGKSLQKIIIATPTGNRVLTFFNQPYLIKTLKPGVSLSFSGTEYEVNGPLIHTGRLVPVYPETKGVSSKALRRRIYTVLNQAKINDWLPQEIQTDNQLISLDSALHKIHFPQNNTEIQTAKKRLAFNEMFLLQLAALKAKKNWQQKKLSARITIDQEKLLTLINSLPFTLTNGQNKCLKEIFVDLVRNIPMNRLLQGEVGSGKTVLAALAMYQACLNGYQAILMAPTVILAQQHYQTLTAILKNTGIKITLVTSGKKATSGNILVGTQALLFKKINSKIGLLVIDEQHRFGVRQRGQLLRGEILPHVLTMTATPIPRTIALTLYRDLAISILAEMPRGRKPIKTWVVPTAKHLDAYHWIKAQVIKHHSQVFIVCPLIDPSEAETMTDIKAVTEEFAKLKLIFNNLQLDLIHGRFKPQEKEAIIARFKNRQTDILVATPVIEVGIDIPQANIMVIENSDRFGLAQLHQLRGRVGRGQTAAFCLLFTANQKPEILKRLQYLETNYSGLKLAELDLRLRGPGDLYGLEQHGFFNLKLASLTDTALIENAYLAAAKIKSLTPALKKALERSKINQYATTA